jgi:hypothetical protein
MSATYTLLSPLPQTEMIDLELECGRALDAWFTEHPDDDDDTGEMGAMGTVPALSEVQDAYKKLGLELDPAIGERLAACRSAFTIDNPGDIETTGGLQVAILQFLLARAGESLILLNDYPFETSESLLERLKSVPSVEGFGEEPEPAPKRRRPVAMPSADGEARAERVLRILESAMNNVNRAIDVKNALHRVSESSRTYGALLLEEGAMPDEKAAQTLGFELTALTEAADELEKALTRR